MKRLPALLILLAAVWPVSAQTDPYPTHSFYGPELIPQCPDGERKFDLITAPIGDPWDYCDGSSGPNADFSLSTKAELKALWGRPTLIEKYSKVDVWNYDIPGCLASFTMGSHHRDRVIAKELQGKLQATTFPLKSCSVRYSGADGELQRPELPVRLIRCGLSVTHTAVVESGADNVIFPLSDAKKLGLDYTTMRHSEAAGVGNLANDVYFAAITLAVNFCGQEYRYPTEVGFMTDLPDVLLGHAGFLDRFQVNLHAPSLEIRPPSGFISQGTITPLPVNWRECRNAADLVIKMREAGESVIRLIPELQAICGIPEKREAP